MLRLALLVLICVLVAALLASLAARSQVSQQTLQDWLQLAASIKRPIGLSTWVKTVLMRSSAFVA